MPCNHKFLDREDYTGLIPNWEFDKLVIGTFNPEERYHPKNIANFFYQRNRNYFWDVFPKFFDYQDIQKQDTNSQIEFLKENRIGITDILKCINDAELSNDTHIQLIQTVRDVDLEMFNDFEWNTDIIIDLLKKGNVKEVYFTKLGNNGGVYPENTFEHQIQVIEEFCNEHNIYNKRIHSPTGMGLGHGGRIDTLYNTWIQNGLKTMG